MNLCCVELFLCIRCCALVRVDVAEFKRPKINKSRTTPSQIIATNSVRPSTYTDQLHQCSRPCRNFWKTLDFQLVQKWVKAVFQARKLKPWSHNSFSRNYSTKVFQIDSTMKSPGADRSRTQIRQDGESHFTAPSTQSQHCSWLKGHLSPMIELTCLPSRNHSRRSRI